MRTMMLTSGAHSPKSAHPASPKPPTTTTTPVTPPPVVTPPVSKFNAQGINTTYESPLSAAIRPTWQNIIPVGSDRDISDYMTAVTQARNAGYATKGKPQSDGGTYGILARGGRPMYARTLLLLDPGTYTLSQIADVGEGVDVMGNGDSRDDVVIVNDGGVDCRYPMRFFGGMFAANLTLQLVPRTGGKDNNYPCHGSDPGTAAWFTTVFDNVHFLQQNPDARGLVGWDMPDGMRGYFYRCRVESTTGAHVIFHDMPNGNTHGVEANFIECEASYDLSTLPDYWAPTIGHYRTSKCTLLDGTAVADIDADGTTVAPLTAAPTIPAGAMTDQERAKYTPLAGDGQVIAPDYGTTSPTQPVADRTYYIPIGTNLDYAALVKSLRLNVAQPGAGVGVSLYVGTETGPTSPVYYPYASTNTGQVDFTSTLTTVFMERESWTYWVGVRAMAGDTTATVDCSTSITGALYEDGGTDWGGAKLWPSTTLTPVTAGDPVPAPSIICGR